MKVEEVAEKDVMVEVVTTGRATEEEATVILIAEEDVVGVAEAAAVAVLGIAVLTEAEPAGGAAMVDATQST